MIEIVEKSYNKTIANLKAFYSDDERNDEFFNTIRSLITITKYEKFKITLLCNNSHFICRDFLPKNRISDSSIGVLMITDWIPLHNEQNYLRFELIILLIFLKLFKLF